MSGIDRFNKTQTFKFQEPMMEDKKQYKKLCVCLDPGHAESTPGKRSPYSLGYVTEPELDFYEYKFNRIICDKLKPLLEEYGIDVFITTTEEDDGNRDVGLLSRAQRANNHVIIAKKKGIFLSIHANAFGNGKDWDSVRGWSAYTTVGQNNSDKLADCLYYYADEIFPEKDMKVRKNTQDGDPDYEENFTVIYKSNMPAVLIENFFYTNIKDAEYLLSEEGEDDIVEVILKGILKFADEVYKM